MIRDLNESVARLVAQGAHPDTMTVGAKLFRRVLKNYLASLEVYVHLHGCRLRLVLDETAAPSAGFIESTNQ